MRHFSILLSFLLLSVMLSPTRSAAQNREVEQDMFEALRPTDKAVVVAIYSGNSTSPANPATVNKLNQKLQAAFQGCAFREAWTSPTDFSQSDRGTTIRPGLTHVLEELHNEGYTQVLLQPSFITDGMEMDYARHEAALFTQRFKQIRIGTTLLSAPEDYEEPLRAIATAYGQKKTANVLIVGGEGSNSPTQAALLDYMLRHHDFDNWFVLSGDGFPTVSHLQKQMKQKKLKKINLIPCTFSTVSQATVEELTQQLRQAGFKVSHTPHTLGEIEAVQALIVKHAIHTRTHRSYTPLEIKLQEAAHIMK